MFQNNNLYDDLRIILYLLQSAVDNLHAILE